MATKWFFTMNPEINTLVQQLAFNLGFLWAGDDPTTPHTFREFTVLYFRVGSSGTLRITGSLLTYAYDAHKDIELKRLPELLQHLIHDRVLTEEQRLEIMRLSQEILLQQYAHQEAANGNT